MPRPPSRMVNASDERRVLEALLSVGPPDFSSSSTIPRGLDAILTRTMAASMQSTSIESVEYVVHLVDLNNYLGEYPQVFRIFFYHLQSTPPTRCITEADKLKTLIGAKAFQGLKQVHYHLIARHNDQPHRNESFLAHCLTDSWPAIWKWIEYLYAVDPGIFSSLTYPIDATSLRAMIIRFIGDITVGGPTTFGNIIMATSGVLPVLADIWAKTSGIGATEGQCRMESSIATMIIHNLIKFEPARAHIFVGALGGDIPKVVTLMLKFIQRALNSTIEQTALRESQTSLALISLLISLLPALHHALLSQNSMVSISRAFAKLSTMRDRPPELDYITGGVSRPGLTSALSPADILLSKDIHISSLACLSFFAQASSVSGGFTWIIQAVRSGMILAMVRSACRSNDDIDEMLELAIAVLQQYLVYRSVLRALSKAFQDPNLDILESGLSQERKFWGSWVKFRAVVREVLATKKKFDIDGEHAQRCYSARCNRVEGDESFKLCSNCQEACYCSPACKRYDWKYEGHREACASLSKDRADGVSPPISPRDLTFFHFLAISHVIIHRDEILKLRDEYFADNDHSKRRSFMIRINHSECPLQLSISTHREQFEHHQYKSTRHYSHRLSIVTPRSLSFSAVVDVQIIFPYGIAPVYISYPSDIASTLFGQMQDMDPIIMGSQTHEEPGPAEEG